MRLYHASTSIIENPDVFHSRDNLDFGKGFYLTAFREQAVRYAERFTRRGKEGGVANDKVFNTVDLFFAGVISKDEALGRLRYEKPNHQLCILNGIMLDRHLHFIKAERV